MLTLVERILGPSYWADPNLGGRAAGHSFVHFDKKGRRLMAHYNKSLNYPAHPKDEDEHPIRGYIRFNSRSSVYNGHLHDVYMYGLNDKNIDAERRVGGDIKKISDAITHTPAPHSFHVYTGLRGDPFKKRKLFGVHLLGKSPEGHLKAHLPAFTSASLSPQIALNFSNWEENYGATKRHILKIHIPKGSKHGAYVDHMSGHGEHEFLLDKGKNIRIHPKPEHFVTSRKDEGMLKPVHYFVWHAHIED